MIRKILLAIVLIFLITGIGFAFQNEPDGFRELKWGDAPTEDMRFIRQVAEIKYSMNGNYYDKWILDEKFNIGSAKLSNIFYLFNLYSNQFYRVDLYFNGKNNFEILKIICEGKYGEPTYKSKNSLSWVGDKTKIALYCNSEDEGEKGIFFIQSMKIHSESPEDNKQKELEKAKEDF